MFFAFCNIYTFIYFEVLYDITYYTGHDSGNITMVDTYCGAPNEFLCDLIDTLNTCMSIFIFGLPLIINATCITLLLRKLYSRMSKYQSSALTHAQIVTRRSAANSVTYG